MLDGGEGWDQLYGGPGDDTLNGGPGHYDVLAGGPGADTMDGGAGIFDTASYTASNAGVTIDLSVTDNGYSTGSGGDAEGDKLKNIEYIWGSPYNDTLTGDDKSNYLWGGAGDDTLSGGPQADILVGGPGDDTLTGGDGEDEFVFEPGGGSDTITDFDPAEEEIVLFNFGLSFDDLIITTGTSDTLIEVGDVSITLEGFMGTLVADDFYFDN